MSKTKKRIAIKKIDNRQFVKNNRFTLAISVILIIAIAQRAIWSLYSKPGHCVSHSNYISYVGPLDPGTAKVELWVSGLLAISLLWFIFYRNKLSKRVFIVLIILVSIFTILVELGQGFAASFNCLSF